MIDLRFYIDNKLVPPPVEYRSIEVELNYEDLEEIQVSISQEKFTWVLENSTFINDYIDNGISGGLGIYWGLPFRIELETHTLFDGYIDLVTDAEFSCDKVIAKVRESKGIDWMDEVADGFSFDLLYNKGFISDSDFIRVPYIINEIPDYQNAALYALYSFVMAQSIKDSIKELVKALADISAITTTVAGILKIVILTIYIIFLIVALIKMVIEIMNNLYQPVKYHSGMLVKKHFEAACSYLGLTFESSLLDVSIASTTYDKDGVLIPAGYWSNLSIIPVKNNKGYKKNQATSELGYFEGTFGDFVRAMSELFNAKFVIRNNVFRFERRDFGSSTQTYVIPDVRNDFYGTNANELVSNYLLQFQIDNLDLNTITRYTGTNAKNFITSKVKDPNRVELIKGFRQPNIPFALGRRKNGLTLIETFVLAFALVFDFFLRPLYILINLARGLAKKGANNETPTLSQQVAGRDGALNLSSDFIGVQKLLLLDNITSSWDVNVSIDNDTKLSAENIWNKYHFINSMVATIGKPSGNQKIVRNIPVIPFCIEDYEKIRGVDNEGEAKVTTASGNPAKILSLKWNIWNSNASIKFAEEKLFTTNLEEQLIIGTGEPESVVLTKAQLQQKLLADFLNSKVNP